jgi:Holliday junction resolvase-like predicted endonuclease
MFFKFKKTENTGEKGEERAIYFLKKKGFKIVEKNYRKPWGEIDIVAKKDGTTHIIEVKAFTPLENRPLHNADCRGDSFLKQTRNQTSHKNSLTGFTDNGQGKKNNDFDEPADRLTKEKIRRLLRISQTYLEEKGIWEEEWQIDVLFITFFPDGSEKIDFIENPVLK